MILCSTSYLPTLDAPAHVTGKSLSVSVSLPNTPQPREKPTVQASVERRSRKLSGLRRTTGRQFGLQSRINKKGEMIWQKE